MTGHAKLSPSAAERWMTCPGSVVLSEGMPEKSSEFAEEGTRAHSLAEHLLQGNPTPADADPGMLEHVMVYVEHVEGIKGHAVSRHYEQRVHVNEDIYGTADAIVWHGDTDTLYVRDYKHGAGVAVEVQGNLQLKIYALAALLTMKYPARHVDVGIVQPRCPHSDGPIRTVRFDVTELVDFHADLLDASQRVENAVRDHMHNGSFAGESGTIWLQPSEKGCRWCLAAPKCPALKGKAQELARQVFAPGLPYDPKALAETLDFLPILEGWVKNTREFAYGEAEKGHEVPNWKLVEKRASRKWRDEDEAAATIDGLGLGVECYEAPKVKSPAAIEKLLPKEKRDVLDELTVKESSGHTLVHESDKRPAIKVDAKSAFA